MSQAERLAFGPWRQLEALRCRWHSALWPAPLALLGGGQRGDAGLLGLRDVGNGDFQQGSDQVPRAVGQARTTELTRPPP